MKRSPFAKGGSTGLREPGTCPPGSAGVYGEAMQGGHTQQVDRIRRSLSLVPPFVTLSVGVVLPVLLSTAAGIVAIVAGESSLTLILGILVVCFTVAAIGGATILYVLLGRRARLVRLQSDLLANVTHELRTPLAAIRVHAQTLQSGLLAAEPARAAESLRTIVRETEWLDAMIDRVLSWRAATRDRDSPHWESGPAAAGARGDRRALPAHGAAGRGPGAPCRARARARCATTPAPSPRRSSTSSSTPGSTPPRRGGSPSRPATRRPGW